MADGNEAFWSMVRKECLLEDMRSQRAAERMGQVLAHREERPATQGRQLRVHLGRLLTALGHRLKKAAALTTEGV